jgi:tetratricopeptide (TPR) repeat protein
MVTRNLLITICCCFLLINCNTNTVSTPQKYDYLSDPELAKLVKEIKKGCNYQEAVLILDEAIKRDSSQGEYYFKRELCICSLGSIDSEIDGYKKAIELNYRVGDANFNLGLCYECLFMDSLALKCFQNALEFKPNSKLIKMKIEDAKYNILHPLE